MGRHMSSKQRLRYLGICFAIFAVLMVYTFVNNRSMKSKSARQFCIYAGSEQVAVAYEKGGYKEEFLETFLQDPFTDEYYAAFVSAYNKLDAGKTAEAISTERISAEPEAVADELLMIYNALRETKEESETEGSGSSRWDLLRSDTWDAILKENGGEMPYASLVVLSEKSTEE